MRKPFDYSLYLVTDRSLCLGRDLLYVIQQAVQGGVSIVQLREKQNSTAHFVKLAREVKRLLEPKGIPLFINDRVDVALAVQAEGVHVGQDDMAVDDVRRLVGGQMAVGLSVNTLQQVREAEKLDVDYLGLGPIFPTKTKQDSKEEVGADGVRAIRSETGRTLVAIGGLDVNNVYEIIRAGADGAAVVSSICSAPDPLAKAQELRKTILSAKDEVNADRRRV